MLKDIRRKLFEPENKTIKDIRRGNFDADKIPREIRTLVEPGKIIINQ